MPFQEALIELRKVCGGKGLLPKSCTLSEALLDCVYEGTFDGSKVRIRRVRTRPGADLRNLMEVRIRVYTALLGHSQTSWAFYQVAVMAKHIAHPNIVPLLGVIVNPLELISDWMPGGDLTTYMTNRSDVDRHSLVRFLSTAALHNGLTPPSVI